VQLRRKTKKARDQARIAEENLALGQRGFVAGESDPELQAEPARATARPALERPSPFYEDSTAAPYVEQSPPPPVEEYEHPLDRGSGETPDMARCYDAHLKAKAYDDDPQPERGTPAWDLWWPRERMRNSGAHPDEVRMYAEQQALDRIDALRAQEMAVLADTPADRRVRHERHWRPHIHADILGGTRSHERSRGLVAPYRPPGVKAGG
jgi:hypothetical protein